MNDGFIIFFDGVCNLCNGTVDFLLQADRSHGSTAKPRMPSFKVASLQGQTAAQRLPAEYRRELSSIVLLAGDQVFTKSAAIWRIFARLPWPWRLVAVLRVLPPFLADAAYDWVARNRYRIFGKSDSCRIPTAAEKEYFLE